MKSASPKSKLLKQPRIIDVLEGSETGPTLIFVGGIHGNEPAGVQALREVFKEVHYVNGLLKGKAFAIAGNISALQKGLRYIDQDLNRMWTKESVEQHLENNSELPPTQEAIEMKELYDTLQHILKTEVGPFYFFDLHTTSSKTIPFLTVNDNLLNRRFTKQYPAPIILGIEEYLEGPLLSYINELGYVAFGFEGGQHDDPKAIENHKAFIYCSLEFCGMLHHQHSLVETNCQILDNCCHEISGMFEIFQHYKLRESDQFIMQPGYQNFSSVTKHEVLASHNGKPVTIALNAKIFMPLYQQQGTDGFFLIKPIPNFFLKLSAILRKWKIHHLLPILPGVRWASAKKDALLVNRKLARFFARDFFHLLGYRSKTMKNNHLVVRNRESVAKTKLYKKEAWFHA